MRWKEKKSRKARPGEIDNLKCCVGAAASGRHEATGATERLARPHTTHAI